MITITTGDLYIRANYQDFRRMQEVDLAIAADGEATLPSLIDAVKRLTTRGRQRVFQERGAKLARRESSRCGPPTRGGAATRGTRAPSAPRALRGDLGTDQERRLVARLELLQPDTGGWARRLWDFTKSYQWLGHAGGGGIGYGAPASVGGALANRQSGRLSVAIQTDGDLMYAPGVLWTAAHHRFRSSSVMHNNRAYHMEPMHVQRMCNARNRGVDRGNLGSEISAPEHRLREDGAAMGVYRRRPDHGPEELGPALRRAIAVVKRGEPALVDVVTQVR